MFGALIVIIFFGVWFDATLGMFPPRAQVPKLASTDEELALLTDPAVPVAGTSTFTQPIDHENPSVGSFSQTYWYNSTYWTPGSPIVIFTPGEEAAAEYTGYLTERALTGVIAKEIGGAVILIEHRYWGDSNPYPVQSTTNLQYLTLNQSINDLVNFAQNVVLPFDTGRTSIPSLAPWVFSGGSYSGALSAWIEQISPGTFWAYQATSGPVEAIYDFWEYYYPIQQGMPQNCSNDYAAIIAYVDNIFINGTAAQKTALKKQFALGDLAHDDDAASAISSPIWYWQSIQQYEGYSTFYQFCDAIEGFAPGQKGTYTSTGIGVTKALPNFAKWFTTYYIPGYCESYGYSDWSGVNNVQCFDSYNASMEVFNDWSDTNGFDRPWVWMTCNEPFFYWQTGEPVGMPTLMSRLANASYLERQCGLYFPTEGNYTYASARGVTEDYVNSRTLGWFNTETTRLIYVNGEFDPWRSASVSSTFRPGGPFNGTADVPVILIPGSRHCNDLLIENNVDKGVAAAQAAEISQISKWVAEFPG